MKEFTDVPNVTQEGIQELAIYEEHQVSMQTLFNIPVNILDNKRIL